MKKDPLSVNEVTYQFYNWLVYWKQTSPVMKDVKRNHTQFIILNWVQVWLISNLHTHKETKNNSLLLIWNSTKAIPSRTVHLNTTNSYQKSVRLNEVHFLQYISQKKYSLSALMPVCNERGSTLLLLLWTALYGKLIKKTYFSPVYLNTCVSHIPGSPFGPCSPLSPGDPFSPF